MGTGSIVIYNMQSGLHRGALTDPQISKDNESHAHSKAVTGSTMTLSSHYYYFHFCLFIYCFYLLFFFTVFLYCFSLLYLFTVFIYCIYPLQ